MVLQANRKTDQALVDEMAISDQEIKRRKEYLNFSDEDEARLRGINPLAERYADSIIEEFYAHLFAFEETREFFRDPNVLAYAKRMQRQYFLRLTQGNYDREYVEERLRVGSVHASIGLDVKWYLGSYSFYLKNVTRRIFDEFKADLEKALETFLSLRKLVFLDIGLTIETYIFQRERTIRMQQDAIRELSTPVLKVRERLLIVPIVGMLDSMRARQMTSQILHSIRDNRARMVVIDITGVPTVDTEVANHLIQSVEAAGLMGAKVIVTGLSAEVAQALVKLGLDPAKFNPVGDLQGGLEEADQMLGYRVVQGPEVAGSRWTGRGEDGASPYSEAR
jgi:rsbT co-antagonist protein RsbR